VTACSKRNLLNSVSTAPIENAMTAHRAGSYTKSSGKYNPRSEIASPNSLSTAPSRHPKLSSHHSIDGVERHPYEQPRWQQKQQNDKWQIENDK